LYFKKSTAIDFVRPMTAAFVAQYANLSLTPYLITKQTDRMGMRVIDKSLENLVNSNIRSEGIIKGAIQVPGDGNPIILLSDHPTTGGYPKVGSIIFSDYDDLIQQNSNKEIYFQLVTLQAAEQQFVLYIEKIKRKISSIEKI
jgi:allophanate hydrolase subunit 2